jgi:hypothetical protein
VRDEELHSSDESGAVCWGRQPSNPLPRPERVRAWRQAKLAFVEVEVLAGVAVDVFERQLSLK